MNTVDHQKPASGIKDKLGSYCADVVSVQFSRSVVSDSLRPPWTAVYQASLSITNSWSLLKLLSTQSVMPSNHHLFIYLFFAWKKIF